MKAYIVLLLLFPVERIFVTSQCPAGTVRMQRTEQNGDEGNSITVNFFLDCMLMDTDFTVGLTYSNKGTTTNNDYDTSTTTVNIPAGTMFFGTGIDLSADATVEEDEAFCVVLASVGSGGAGSDVVVLSSVTSELSTTVTIINDDTATVSITPSSFLHLEGDADTTATVTLGWSNTFQDAGFTQVLSYIDGSTDSSDYTTVSTTVTLPPSPVTSIEVPITITGDTFVEGDEIFTISLAMASAPAGYVNTDAIITDATSVSSEVTISDDDTPTMISCPTPILFPSGDSGMLVVWNELNCPDGKMLDCNGASTGQIYPPGIYTIMCSCEEAGFSDTCSFSFTIEGPNSPPQTPTCPDFAVTVTTTLGATSAEVTYSEVQCSDNQGTLTAVCSQTSGITLGIGTTPVTCTCTDNGGLTSTCSFIIIVQVPNSPPQTPTCPDSAVTVITTLGATSAEVTFSGVHCSDNQGTITAVCSQTSGVTLGIGTTPVTCTCTDNGGLTSTCSFIIVVQDLETADERLSHFTTVLSGENVTSEEIQMAADFIQRLTREEDFVTEDDNRVQLVAVSLEAIAEADHPSLEITEPVVEIVNNLLGYSNDAFQTTEVNSGRIVSALEGQVSNFQTADGNYTDVLQNIGVSAVKINPNSVEISLNFANIAPENRTVVLGSDIRDGKTQLFDNEADVPLMETVTSISVPTNVLKSLTNETLEQTVVPVSFFLYGNSNLFIPSKPLEQVHVESGSNATVTEIISSQIISARIEDETVRSTGFPSDTRVITKFITNLILDIDEDIQAEDCVFWHYNQRTGEGFWSNDGCDKMPDELDLTVCSCDRLGSFAVLVRVRKGDFKASVPLYYITLIGSIVSGICLILCIITFLSLKQLRSKQPTHIHINLCISLFGFYVAFLLSLLAVQYSLFCALSSAAIHFFCLATVAWMSAEAINMYFLFVKMERKALHYFIPVACVLCYGCPLLLAVLVGLLDQNSHYETSTYCFIHPGFALYFGFLAEVAILFAFNFVIFIMVIQKMLCRPLMASRTRENARRNEIITRLRHGILFWFVLGLSWIFGFLAAVDPKTLTFDYLYCIFISLQGLIMFILLCAANPEFRKHFQCKKSKSLNSKSVKSTSSTGLNLDSQSDLAMSDMNT